MTPDSESNLNGFPAGYFIIKSVATNRVLDVAADAVEDGSDIILWPESETSLVESFRNPNSNNQVWFIDSTGALCSRSSGHAIDVEGEALVLRHRRPVSLPFPNIYSHPFPTFVYSPTSGEISVQFKHDPTYSPTPSTAWKNKSYILSSIPLRKPRTVIDEATEFLSSALQTPLAMLTGNRSPTSAVRPEEVFNGSIDLHDDEVLEEDRGAEGEVDDSHDMLRRVKLLTIDHKSEEDWNISEQAKNRRRWVVHPLRIANARTGPRRSNEGM